MTDLATSLGDPKACGVFQLTREPYEVERDAKAAGLAVARMEIGHAHHKEEFYAHIVKALGIPTDCSTDPEALKAALGDLSWLGDAAKGCVLVFEKSKHFGAGHRHEFEAAVGLLQSVSDGWKARGKPFWAFIHGAQGWDSGLPHRP
jgi:Barstar (barnase inhibitor)